MSETQPETPPAAAVHARAPWSAIWLIPLVAAVIAGFLAWRTLSQRGPLITVTFSTAQGLTAGQTKVEHKAVVLGTVETIRLSQDMSHVIVQVRMAREAADRLTDNARFWVVRPRFDARNLSGLDTLVSGAYLEMDPGKPGAQPKYDFTGLEEPPGVRSDEPGSSFELSANSIGSLGVGSPVFYRDVPVGEVINYDLHQGIGPATVNLFIRAPFDRLVKESSRFWNASGLSVELGAQGVHVQVESLQALVSGGVAFDTPSAALDGPPPATGTTFRLYSDKARADGSRFRTQLPVVAYFRSSVRGLATGAPVLVYGIQIGLVTEIRLLTDVKTGNTQVRVAMEVQPERILGETAVRSLEPLETARQLVARGMRAQLITTSFLTQQLAIGLDFATNPPPAEVTVEKDGSIVLPSENGGLDDITSALSGFANKLNALPLDQISQNLNNLITTLNQTVGGDEMKQTLRSLSATMASVQELVRHTDAGLTPALNRLPKISDDLQQTMARANRVLGSVEAGYGNNSEFSSSVQRVLDQVNDAARSIRELADFLDRHPEALIRGRAETGASR